MKKIMKVNVGMLIFKIPESVPYDSFAMFQIIWSKRPTFKTLFPENLNVFPSYTFLNPHQEKFPMIQDLFWHHIDNSD